MSQKNNLYILWTNDNLITSEKMVFMYGINSKRNGWWKNVTIIIWGATAKLVSENKQIQMLIEEAKVEGVTLSACKACAEQLGVTKQLEEIGIEVIYWGTLLTKLIKENEKLLTI